MCVYASGGEAGDGICEPLRSGLIETPVVGGLPSLPRLMRLCVLFIRQSVLSFQWKIDASH